MLHDSSFSEPTALAGATLSDVALPETLQDAAASETLKYVTFHLSDQMFGIQVLQVEDILRLPPMTPIPLALPEIMGTHNLRGRIVTMIDLRTHLKLPPYNPAANEGDLEENSGTKQESSSLLWDKRMTIVIVYKGDLYSIVVDAIGDVITLKAGGLEKNFGTLDPKWRSICSGITRLEQDLVLILEPNKLMVGIEKMCLSEDEILSGDSHGHNS